MRIKLLLMVFFLEYLSVEARPQITSFSVLQGSTKWDIGEPRLLPELAEILPLTLPHSVEKFKSTGFSYCNKLLTLNPREVFTVTFPVDRKSCLIYLRAPKGYLLEQRIHPIVRFASCNKEQLRFSNGQYTLVYCDGSHPVHFPGDQDYVAIMYEGVTSSNRQVIRFAISLKPVDFSLPGSTKDLKTGTSEIVWQDPEAEYVPRAVFELARQDESLQICPKTCGASNKDGAYRLVSGTVAEEGEIPYMVRISVDYKPPGYTEIFRVTCGGSILNSRYVLTAAHCLLDEEKRDWDLVGRKVYDANFDSEKNQQGQEIDIESFVVHPEYISFILDDLTDAFRPFDIAVVKLSEDLQFGHNSWTICLAPGLDFMNKHATIAGYGYIYQDTLETGEANEPQEYPWKAGVVIADYDKKCKLFDQFKSPENMYRKACTFGMSKESCHGDTGSPVAVSEGSVWYQVGVATGGYCGRTGEPHFHSNVTTFADFIRQSVKGGRCH